MKNRGFGFVKFLVIIALLGFGAYLYVKEDSPIRAYVEKGKGAIDGANDIKEKAKQRDKEIEEALQ